MLLDLQKLKREEEKLIRSRNITEWSKKKGRSRKKRKSDRKQSNKQGRPKLILTKEKRF